MKKKAPEQSHAERLVKTCAEIVAELLDAHYQGISVNLNQIKAKHARRNKLSSQPRLVDIIAAIPEEHRKELLPKLKAKPVRTASGIAVVAVMCKPHRCPHIAMTGNICLYCVSGDTRITLAGGISTRIDQMQPLLDNQNTGVLSFSSSDNGQQRDMCTAWAQRKELRDCLEFTLLDGRTIKCTPDHELLTSENGWMEAGDIRAGEHSLVCGVSYPEVDLGQEVNKQWQLQTSNISLAMGSLEALQRSMAYSRIVGMLHGSQTSNITFTSPMDMDAFQQDIDNFSGCDEGYESAATSDKESRLLVKVPQSIAVPSNVPEYISNPSCPLILVRSFLSGFLSSEQGLVPQLTPEGDLIWNNLHSSSQKETTDLFDKCVGGSQREEWLNKLSFVYNGRKQMLAEAFRAYSKNQKQLSATRFLEKVGALSWFTSSAVTTDNSSLPAMQMDIVEINESGQHAVYDISVHNNECFLGNGIVAHNCPGGPDSDFEYSTQSYTGYEPTSMRAIRARYDPYDQARGRVDQLKQLGHSVDKVEYIIMGGTFMSLNEEYRNWFIMNLHDALSGHRSNDVDEAVRMSEQSETKCIGITIETRPDAALKPHLSHMLRYGCTRLELGVQSVYEDVARDTNRGHTVRAVCESFQLAKDAGYKVVAHMMPDLPNVGMERDIEQFKEYFENPLFRSDGLKLYPTLVIRGTGLYELWRTGRYRNYTPNALIDLVARILALVPPWTRVYRVQRDIPMPLVSSGVENGNLRELALQRMRDLGTQCRDVRTREVGIVDIHSKVQPDQVELIRRDYTANGGWETFLSYEDPDQDILIGLLRLRKCSPETFRPELTLDKVGGQCSIVRELHVYGSVVPVHSRDPKKFQHQGFGTLLMEEAERISREEHGSIKLAVISGVGTRHYYRKLGYELDGPYMSKSLV